MESGNEAAYKWLPVVSDYCTGCARCVDACPHECLDLVWEFATLQHPEDCVSEGVCVTVCPEGDIRMEWVKTTASQEVGRWCEAPEPLPSRPRSGLRSWLGAWLGNWLGDASA